MSNVKLKVALWEYVDGMAANCELIDVKAAALELSRRFPESKMHVDHIGREIKRAAKAAKASLRPEGFSSPISPRSSRHSAPPFDHIERADISCRKEIMTPFQYRVNQCVRFRYHERTRASAPGNYKILGYQPIENGEPRYRIKSELEQHERIARECELSQAE